VNKIEKIIAIIGKLVSWLIGAFPKTETAAEACAGAKRLREGIQRGFHHELLRRYGCYFFALLRWAEEARGRGFREDDIVSIFEQCQGQRIPGTDTAIITATGFVNDPVRLLNFLAGKKIVQGVRLWTNDGGHPIPRERIFVARERHPAHGAHFVLFIDGRRWDSLPLDGRTPAGFRVLA